MPLPAALAARLAKRGLIKNQPTFVQPVKPVEEIEEVFAEDYDDVSKPEVPEVETNTNKLTEDIQEETKETDDAEYIHEVTACPNRSNPYHTCVKFCKNKWGMKTFTPDLDMIQRRDRMMRKYPLPDGWKEVADPDSNRYYYWSMQTDQVCWLSPGHPNAVISMPAEKLTGGGVVSSLDEDFEFDNQGDDMEPLEDEPMDADSDMSDSSSDSDSEEERQRTRRDDDRRKQGGNSSAPWHDRDKRDSRRGRGSSGRSRRDEIDPMDPAAYSDIPRGGWTDGLDTRGAAKTGVDVTASGPLFQQRPYPSPGDILRANQQLKK